MTHSGNNKNPTTLRCWAEVNLAALQHNAAVVRKQIASTVKIMAVVKANAYGHGVTQVVEALAAHVDAFGVANLSEAQQIKSDSLRPIFILSPSLPDERQAVLDAGFIPFISSFDEARAYADLQHAGDANIHLMIDTGMGRMGVKQNNAIDTVRAILALPGVHLDGICTHLPVADEAEDFTQNQLQGYDILVKKIRAIAPDIRFSHALNSAGIIRFSSHAGEMVRPGLMLYGCSPIATFQKHLRPILTLKTRVGLVRKINAGSSVSYGRTFIASRAMTVATLGIGYADGLPRALSNQGATALIQGTRCPLLGRVTMDQIVVDITHLDKVELGEEAVLIGHQGSESIPVAEVAAQANTIDWEVLTHLQCRAALIYTST